MKKPREIPDGTKIKHLTVISTFKARKERRLIARCDCGAVKEFSVSNVFSGTTSSCGCYNKVRAKLPRSRMGGYEGGKQTKEYKAWCGIKCRTSNPNSTAFKNWGGRGITMCERWVHSFPNFLSDMGFAPSPHHSIDRINNDGNYEPGNCRWATRNEQARNRRDTRLNDDRVLAIKAMRTLGMGPKRIGAVLGVSFGTIGNVLYNDGWK